MSIRIDRGRCTGCGKCADICPGGLPARDDGGKAYLRMPRDCWGCASCLKVCPAQAITLYLGADIGGMGGALSVREQGETLVWTVRREGEADREIAVDRRAANRY